MTAGCLFKSTLFFIGLLALSSHTAWATEWEFDTAVSENDLKILLPTLLMGNMYNPLPPTKGTRIQVGGGIRSVYLPGNVRDRLHLVLPDANSKTKVIQYPNFSLAIGSSEQGILGMSISKHPLSKQTIWGFGLNMRPKIFSEVLTTRISYVRFGQNSVFCAPGMGLEALTSLPELRYEPYLGAGIFATKGDYEKNTNGEIFRKKYTFTSTFITAGFRAAVWDSAQLFIESRITDKTLSLAGGLFVGI